VRNNSPNADLRCGPRIGRYPDAGYNPLFVMKRVWLVGLFLAIASAGAASAAEGVFDVRLIEPAEHAEVVAGSTVPIAWDAGSMPPGIDEWEAFLSVDGGNTYPIRITPHLDAGIHRFHWTVPSLPGADVSVLLRFGDERQESEFSFASRARITGTVARQTLREPASARSATEDDHGRTLTAWVEGSREGSDLRQVVVAGSWLVADHEWSKGRDHDSAPAIGTKSKRAEHAMCASRADGVGVAASQQEDRPFLPPYVAEVLLLTGRLNI